MGKGREEEEVTGGADGSIGVYGAAGPEMAAPFDASNETLLTSTASSVEVARFAVSAVQGLSLSTNEFAV